MNIEIPSGTKELSLNLSGGADSAMLLYILALNFKGIIRPLTAVEIDGGINLLAVNEIVNLIRNLLPSANIANPIVTYFKQTDAFESKAKHFKTVMKSLISKVHFDGTTSNPPLRVMKELDMYTNRFSSRDKNDILKYRPFGQIDKSEIAKLYIQYDLMDNLLPLTASCVMPINITEPCKECWWCKEKYWAFGRYDFEY